MVTKGDLIRNKAVELLKANPEGLRFSELKAKLAEKFPVTNGKWTIDNAIWNIHVTREKEVYKPARGLFKYRFSGETEPEKTTKTVTKQIETYHFGQAAETIYEFFWHVFCDKYIEMVKPRLFSKDNPDFQPDNSAFCTLYFVLCTSLKLLHPFMPFVTETIWQQLPNKPKEPLIISPWPKA